MDSIEFVTVKKIGVESISICEDIISIEEPLEIRIGFGPQALRKQQTISITMRTPGNDIDLAIGFLFTEGIISSYEEVKGVVSKAQNVILVELHESVIPNVQSLERNSYTTSSCGVCGKTSLEAIHVVQPQESLPSETWRVDEDLIFDLKEKLTSAQKNFSMTGGLHASGLFNLQGELLLLREDVGRHNALDKLIGSALSNQSMPLSYSILLLSGRISFELVQKSVMAGVKIIVAIGAPSSMAVSTAKEHGITLIGFLKKDRFNIYNTGNFIQLNTVEKQNIVAISSK